MKNIGQIIYTFQMLGKSLLINIWKNFNLKLKGKKQVFLLIGNENKPIIIIILINELLRKNKKNKEQLKQTNVNLL